MPEVSVGVARVGSSLMIISVIHAVIVVAPRSSGCLLCNNEEPMTARHLLFGLGTWILTIEPAASLILLASSA